MLLNLLPRFIGNPLLNLGWGFKPAANLEDARRFRAEVGLPIIANGGFQQRSLIDAALNSQGCDLVSMARPLLANPDLIQQFKDGADEPKNPCTFCNKCTVRTTLYPLGCYDRSRFSSDQEMEANILAWSANLDDEISEKSDG